MALSVLKTWGSERLTSTDLNAEFANIVNNALSLISPLTGQLDSGGNDIINLDELEFNDGAADPTTTARLRLSGSTLQWRIEDARTNTTIRPFAILATTTGTPAASIGVGMRFDAESGDEAPSQFGALDFVASDITAASEDTYLSVLLRVAGAALDEKYRFSSTAGSGFAALFTHAVTADRTFTLPDVTSTIAVLGLAQTWTADQTFNDNVNVTFGTGGDADIRYDATDLLILPAVVGTGDVRISGGSLRTQDSEGVWFGTGDDARIYYDGTDFIFDSDVVGTGNFLFSAARAIFLNETANANMTTGITINTGTAINLAFALKSDVAHGVTTIPTNIDAETDDFFRIFEFGATGGVQIEAIGTTANTRNMEIFSFSGAPSTTDTSASLGAIGFYVAQHNGSNGLVDMAADSNGWTWGELDSAASIQTRMLLKADDGELHLGNTTLVALDEEDDPLLVRHMMMVASNGQGIKKGPLDTADFGVPAFSYEKLHALGILGERDKDGFCLFPVQTRFAMNEGAIWQLYCKHMELKEHIEFIEKRLLGA